MIVRSSRYLNNLIEQDHRRVKHRINPMLGFKRFANAVVTISGIELAEKIKLLRRFGNRLWPPDVISFDRHNLAAQLLLSPNLHQSLIQNMLEMMEEELSHLRRFLIIPEETPGKQPVAATEHPVVAQPAFPYTAKQRTHFDLTRQAKLQLFETVQNLYPRYEG